MKNQNNTGTNNLFNAGHGNNGGASQIEAQLSECLEKLNLVIASQKRLEKVITVHGLLIAEDNETTESANA
jgi:hypothetical protein